MANLSDIPDDILELEDSEVFLAWLNEQPMTHPDRLELAALWKEATSTTLTADQWSRIT